MAGFLKRASPIALVFGHAGERDGLMAFVRHLGLVSVPAGAVGEIA